MRQVDTREPWNLRALMLETGWEQNTLSSGDFVFDTHDNMRVGITRKTFDDLFNSIGEVFAHQLDIMLSEFPINIFLLEGSPDFSDTRYTPKEVKNWLHRWQAKGFILERSNCLEYTADRLNQLYALYQKPYSRSSGSRKYIDDRVLAMPSGMRGKKGEKLLSMWSLRDIACMSIKTLEEIDGLGPTLAGRVYQHFNRR